MSVDSLTVGARAFREHRTIQVVDLGAEIDTYPDVARLALSVGVRTILAVPLLREGAAVGVINIRRREALAFSDQQIALLQTFAEQALIAIENVRLFTD